MLDEFISIQFKILFLTVLVKLVENLIWLTVFSIMILKFIELSYSFACDWFC
ncbi:MAG: hypothetical protein QG651_381 [Pseudomonadota bacterium]|nr:hypothetical protein [Pseudomonadota bacterium]